MTMQSTTKKPRRPIRATVGFLLLLPFAIVAPLLTDASYAQISNWLRDQLKALDDGLFVSNS